MAARWAYLGVLDLVVTLAVVALAVNEAVSATTGADRLVAMGEVFLWLGFAFSLLGGTAVGAQVARGRGLLRGRTGMMALTTLLFGLALVAFALATRA